MEKFAFVLHPLVVDDFARKFPIMRYLPDSWIEGAMKHVKSIKISHITALRSPYAEAEGWFIACPLTARQMVTQFGMSDRLGLVTLGKKQHEVFLGREIVEDKNYSDEIAYAIDQEVRSIIDDSFDAAKKILTEHRDRLEEITALLLEKEVLEGDELDELLGYPKKAHRSIDDEFEEGQLASEYKPQDQEEGKTSESDPAADNGDESQRMKKDRAQDDEDPDDEEE